MIKRPLALITGASSGIGKQFAYELAAMGYDLILVARRIQALALIAEEVENDFGISAEILQVDLLKDKEVNTLYQRCNQVDLLVNNAGIGLIGDFIETEEEAEMNMIKLNIESLYRLSKNFGLKMAERGSGGIINIASTAAFSPVPKFAVYAATKAFVLSFSEAIAMELQEYGVRVMVVCPGPTETEFFEVAKFTNRFNKRKGIMSTEKVVKKSITAYQKNKRTVILGKSNKYAIWVSRFLPRNWILEITKRGFKKI